MLKKYSVLCFPWLLSACANFEAPAVSPKQTQSLAPSGYYELKPVDASALVADTTPVRVMTVKPSDLKNKKTKSLVGPKAVNQVNKQAVVQPDSGSALNATIIFPYEPGSLYQIYATPLNVTDVALQEGEQIISVAAGDTMRWEISKTISGSGSAQIEHLLIKPLAENLDTTMVVTTNQRTYHLLLKSTKDTFMATVQWRYPEQNSLSGLSDKASIGNGSGMPGLPDVDLSQVDFHYQVKVTHGDTPDWIPKAVFNDGLKTYIEFPTRIQSAPELFIKQSGSGDAAVNYRVVGNYYVVDQVITAAELMTGNGEVVVSISYKR